jgi:uncharacterized protein
MPCEKSIAADLFECIQCGECCKGYGGTYVTEADIQAIADFMNLSAETVRRRYSVPSGNKRLLVQGENGYCVFLDRNCTIHPVKPRMCRQWPFIAGVLKDVANWRAMASCCPGIRGDADPLRVLACVRAAMPDSQSG